MLENIQIESNVEIVNILIPKTNKQVPSTSFENVSPKDTISVPQQSVESR